MSNRDALVLPIRRSKLAQEDRRTSIRHPCAIEATSNPLEDADTITWGAIVDDISTGGIGLTICYPFRPGTYLSVGMQKSLETLRTVLVRVVHVHDRSDGAWHLGCEFVNAFTDSDMDMLI